MGNPETLVIMSTEDTGEINVRENRTIKNRQSKDTGNTEYARHGRNKGQKIQRTIKNGQSRDTGNIEHARHRTNKHHRKQRTINN